MRIDGRIRLLLALLGLAWAGSAAGEVSVDAATEVSTIRFRSADPHVLATRELRAAIALRERGGWVELQQNLSWLPLVPVPDPRLFSPVELQRDVVRLRGRYADAGYPRASVRYEVTKDSKHNRVAITFVTDPGPPLRVGAIEVVPADSLSPLPVPESERRDWERLMRSFERLRGRPLERLEIGRIERETRGWWQERGHPFAAAAVGTVVDSASSTAHLRVAVAPGGYARVGQVRIEGTRSVKPDVIAREMPFRAGDRFSAAALLEGRREVQQLEIVRLALVDLPETEPRDSSVDVRVRVTEAEPRLVSGQIGYVSDAGVSYEARWSHRNIDRRALSLTLSGAAQTGWLALVDDPDVRYRGSATLRRPYFLDRRLSLLLTPFIEHRDDAQDRSLQYGVDLTALLKLGALQSVALKYGISEKQIYEYRFGDFSSGDIDLLTLLQQRAQGLLDTLGSSLDRSIVTLSATAGTLDEPLAPRRGVVVRPTLEVTTPSGLNSTEYTRMDAGLYGYLPVGRRATLVTRLSAGRVWPFGKSVPGPGESPSVKFLQVRDVSFTAGGTYDVRGWANRLLGPKFPDVRVASEGDTTLVASGYVPIGGLARLTGSLELLLPIPGLGPSWSAFGFLDGGRVWTPDSRFSHGIDVGEQERWFFGTGGGIDLRTPVGPVRFSVGYKLNPSTEDLVDAADLFAALRNGTPLDQLPRDERRRIQYHLSIGSTF